MSLTGSIQKAEKEIVVDFPIADVKTAIMQVFEKLPNRYKLRKGDANEVFSTYRFPATNPLYPGMIDLTLLDVGDGKTKLTLIVTALHGSVSSNTTLNSVLNDYLNVLGKVLAGEPDEAITEPIKNTGCMVLIVIGFASAALSSLFLI